MATFQLGGLVEQIAITATAAGTTTLVNTSKQIQIFTGSTTQTVVLPDATTMIVGQKYEIYNQSTGALTMQFNGGAAFTDASGKSFSSVAANTSLIVKLQTNGSAAGTFAVVTSSGGSAGPYTPTKQTFLSGSGTYTTPANVLYIRVKMAGGGGGGGGGGTGATAGTGGSGANTTFGTSLLTANGAIGGNNPGSGYPPSGGSFTVNGPAIDLGSVQGGAGQMTPSGTSAGGSGGVNPFGGNGSGSGGTVTAAAANSGAGGGGGGSPGTAINPGQGGAAGGFVYAQINNPSATYSYSVATAGAGGTAGTSGIAGGSGGTGVIIVEEFYAPVAALAGSGGAYQPTITKFTTGSGTYTTPANVVSLRVRMVGGGGGGSGGGQISTTGASGSGTNTTFGTSLLVASAGSGTTSGSGSQGGAGGAASLGTGPIGSAINGGNGGAGGYSGAAASSPSGGNGGNSPLGGGGGGGGINSAANSGATNTGGGGGGGGTTNIASSVGGCGGGAGGFIDAIINAPLASYAYSVGTGGSAGTAGTNGSAGATGAAGYIEITEYYANGSVGTATTLTGTISPANVTTSTFLTPSFQALTSGTGATYGVSYWFTVISANATVGAIYTNNGNNFTVTRTISGATQLLCSSNGAPSGGGVLTKSSGTGDATITFSSSRAPVYLRVRAVGGGGGGSGGGTGGATGGSGGNTTFGTSLILCNGSGSGGQGGTGSSAGSSSITAPAIGIASIGNSQGVTVGASSGTGGGIGGASPFGGSGGGSWSTATGSNGAANSGSGAGGGGGPVGSSVYCGQGGASGGYVDAIIYNPSATYLYTIGAGGTAGAAGTSGGNGGTGGSGAVYVEEFFQ